MCTLRLPFDYAETATLVASILNDPLPPIKNDCYSKELIELVSSLLTKDPVQRPSIEQLIQVPIIRNAVIRLLGEFDGKTFIDLITPLNEKDESFTIDLPKSIE